MKPIKLVLSAYGPFPNHVEIDFEKLGEEGVFLVSGATGSGKTTIFDGIVYALYGTASGNLRTPGMMRSTYAKPSIKTFVELTFKSNGKIYRIYRKPEQLVEKLRGKGFTTSPYEVSLEIVGDDSPPYTKKREVDEQIRNIIGLDSNQFRQVTMIAQGEFLKVLNATTEERIAIFSKVFKTEKYRALQEELKSELKKRSEYISQMEDRLSDSFARIIKKKNLQSNPDVKNSIDTSQTQRMQDENSDSDDTPIMSIEEQKSYIEDLLLHNNNKLKSLEASQVDLKRINDKSLLERAKLEEIIDQFVELEKSAKEKELIGQKKKELEIELATLPDRKQEVEITMKMITSLEVERPRYRAVADQKYELGEKANYLRKLKDHLEELSGDIDRLTEETTRKTNELKQLEERVSEKANVVDGISLAESFLRASEDFLNNYSLWHESENDYSKESEDFIKIDNKYKEYQSLLTELESKYLKQQAGILAKNLEEGNPCPVCGSVHHPNLANIEGKEIQRQDIDDAKNKRNILDKERTEAYRKISNLKGRIEALYNHADNSFRKLNEEITFFSSKVFAKSFYEKYSLEIPLDTLNFDTTSIEKTDKGTNNGISRGTSSLRQIDIGKYQEINGQLNTLLNELRSDLSNINNSEELVKNLRNKVRNFEDEIQKLKNEYHDKKDNYNQLVGEYNNASNALNTALKSMEFGGLEELNLKIDELISKKDKLNEEINNISEKKGVLDKEWNRTEGQFETFKKLTEGKDEITARKNLDIISQTITETTSKIQIREKEVRSLNYIVNEEMETLREYEDIIPKLNDAKKFRDIYANLSATCNGDLVGKEKIQLETFVQIAFLDSILVRANSRLLKMTNGRYKLVRQRESMNRRSQTGLDLDVHDLSNDTYRSTRSLSGGESFQASLCLALGLADEIQSSSGGIAIETMFIDEGFGTLDSTALKNAVNNLIDLSKGNKLVGVISHVDYIYQRIPKRIVVEKQIEGGSTVNIQIDS